MVETSSWVLNDDDSFGENYYYQLEKKPELERRYSSCRDARSLSFTLSQQSTDSRAFGRECRSDPTAIARTSSPHEEREDVEDEVSRRRSVEDLP